MRYHLITYDINATAVYVEADTPQAALTASSTEDIFADGKETLEENLGIKVYDENDNLVLSTVEPDLSQAKRLIDSLLIRYTKASKHEAETGDCGTARQIHADCGLLQTAKAALEMINEL